MRCRKILLCLFLGLIPLKLINSQENENTYSILEKSMQSNNWYWGQQRQSWLIDIIKENKNKSDDEKLKIINNFYNNQVRYGSDINIWEKVDYWATPFESLNQGGGDCEDYAIGKYFSLKKMGVKVSKLRLVYVRYYDGYDSIAHMVLTYTKENGIILILDNLDKEIKESKDRKDLTPIFSFNDDGLYEQVGIQKINTNLNKWNDLLERVKKEGW